MPTSDKKKLTKDIKAKDAEVLLLDCYKPGTDEPRDITDETLTFEVRASGFEGVVLTKSSVNPEEIEKTDPVNGKARILLYEADTDQFEKNATLKCQLISTDALGRDNTIMFELPLTYRH